MDRELLERQLTQLPIVEYLFFETEELTFTPKVRLVCETDCPRYGASWACPPAVGTVEECREARERQRGKKPVLSAPCKSINYYLCPNCNKILNINKPFCCDCGSGIDWSEEDV